MKEKNPWKTLKTKEIYDNPWITVLHNDVLTPGGSTGIYGKVHFKNLAVGVVPLDEDNNTWIVGQYRYTLDTYSWEIPEGGCLEDDDPLQAVQRELREETGIRANDWTKIMELHTSNSVCDELAYLYIARDLTLGEAEPEDTEELVMKKLPFSELVAMVHDGKVTDAMSVAAILKVDWLLSQTNTQDAQL